MSGTTVDEICALLCRCLADVEAAVVSSQTGMATTMRSRKVLDRRCDGALMTPGGGMSRCYFEGKRLSSDYLKVFVEIEFRITMH